MYTIAVINQKGGVGKTTSVVHIGVALHAMGRRVLLCDLDPQGHLGLLFGCPAGVDAATMGDLLLRRLPADRVVHPLAPGFALIRATRALGDIEAVDLEKAPRKEYRLKSALAVVTDTFDYALIDCPPHLGNLTVNGLTAADGVVLATATDVLSLNGLARMLAVVTAMREEEVNPALAILGILPTRHRARTVHARRILDRYQANPSGIPVFTAIPETIAFSEAVAHRQTLFSFAPQSSGAVAYRAVSEEIDCYVQQASGHATDRTVA
jgi:chromosome partitioning protein